MWKFLFDRFTTAKIPWPGRRFWVAQFLISMLIASLFSLLSYYELPPISTLEYLLQDTLVRFRVYHLNDNKIKHTAIVDVDDETLSSAGQWPWPRYRTANLLRIVSRISPSPDLIPPASIALDILFSEPDRSSLTTIQKSFKKDFDLDITFGGIPPGMDDNDGYLGSIIASTKAVTAYFMYFDRASHSRETVLKPLKVTGNLYSISPPLAYGFLCNMPSVQRPPIHGGFINALLDKDGILRSLPLLVSYKGNWFPGLSLAAVMRAQDVDSIHIDEDFFGPVIVVGQARFPVDETGRAIIGFVGQHGTVPTISAVDALSQDAQTSMLGDRIVFLGSSATVLQDLYQTPMGAGFPGVEIHAILAENSMTNTSLRVPVWRGRYSMIVTLVTGLAVFLCFMFLSPGRAAVLALGVGIIPLAAGLWFLLTHGILLPMATPLPLVVLLSFLLSLLLYRKERSQVLSQLRQFSRFRQTILEAMAAVAETRDSETGGHIKRTQHYIRILARHMAKKKHYPELTSEYIEMIFQCAALHDIGKVGIPDNILLKPGALTREEYEIMKEHSSMGKTIIENSCKNEEDKIFFELAAELAYTHHERWDGQGYPEGLSGEEIPVSGRLMALVDVYDALVSKRHYKDAFNHETAKNIIMEGSGSQFDPHVVDSFLELEKDFLEISKKFSDLKFNNMEKPV